MPIFAAFGGPTCPKGCLSTACAATVPSTASCCSARVTPCSMPMPKAQPACAPGLETDLNGWPPAPAAHAPAAPRLGLARSGAVPTLRPLPRRPARPARRRHFCGKRPRHHRYAAGLRGVESRATRSAPRRLHPRPPRLAQPRRPSRLPAALWRCTPTLVPRAGRAPLAEHGK